MNKTAIKNFAVWARRKLISEITYKAGLLGITEKGIADPIPQSTKDLQFFDVGTKDYTSVSGNEIKQRNALVKKIKDKEKQLLTPNSSFLTALQSVIEEVAYTWFNRLIAIRFMEVNDYLPSRIRVLSSENPAKLEPDFVTTPFDTDLEFSAYERDRVMQLKDENKLDELFRMLFIKQCNKLNENLSELFEKTDDYTELLLTISFTDKDGVVYHLVHDIDEDDFNVEKEGQVEIIGWMYQYYNDERKNEVINIYKGTVKKEDIPAATQLFTTDWVVRYMVDNSLGRYWIERNPQSKLHEKLEFFVAPKEGDIAYINEKIEPKDLTFFDPCMGSGHILVYAFDVLMEIYRECGYSDRDAALCILQDNIYGLDIDNRAYQLAYFAVMMKARSFNRRALTAGVWNFVATIEESNEISGFYCNGITNDKVQNEVGEYLVSTFKHAKEIGSLLSVEAKDYRSFYEYLLNLKIDGQTDIFSSPWFNNTMPLMKKLIKQAYIMSRKYAVVCTNPPYMNKLESHLKEFVTTRYKPYSGDLFSVFMYRNFEFCKKDGYSAFMTPFVWMFIKTYENLREFIINNKSIATLVQMEYSAFEEATVPICSFVLRNANDSQNGMYVKLSDFKGGMEIQKQKVLEAIEDKKCSYLYETSEENFVKIPGMPIAYWVSDKFINVYDNTKLGSVYVVRQGMTTSDNNRFIRLWYETDLERCSFSCENSKMAQSSGRKWFAYNKGGEFRKWYGNKDYVVNYFNNGEELEEFHAELNKTSSGGRLKSREYYFNESITWSFISSSKFGVRYSDYGSIFDVAGSSLFPNHDYIFYITGFMCSCVTFEMLSVANPTLNYQAQDIKSLPLIIDKERKANIETLVKQCINISKYDWDSFETSWDFTVHPLVRLCHGVTDENGKEIAYIEDVYNEWEFDCDEQFNQLKANEEELNRIFINIYGLQEELTPDVEDKDVTIRKADLGRDIRSFISYAVGCMFGRYSLDVEGLAFAGGNWNEKYITTVQNNIKSTFTLPMVFSTRGITHICINGDNIPLTYIPDADNCIPITDEEYFSDDIVGLFVDFVKRVYGKETLEGNLDFIANALGNRGNTSRETIRNYFIKDFYKDHCKIYQKRPIYWLFDSGKEDGFKALIYMHRYNADTIGTLRIDYLHKMQKVYESEISRMQETIDNSTNVREVAAAEKRKEKLIKQLKETKDYDAKIAHLALARVEIDLDDGVKVNYEKVQTGTDGKKLDVLGII